LAGDAAGVLVAVHMSLISLEPASRIDGAGKL